MTHAAWPLGEKGWYGGDEESFWGGRKVEASTVRAPLADCCRWKGGRSPPNHRGSCIVWKIGSVLLSGWSCEALTMHCKNCDHTEPTFVNKRLERCISFSDQLIKWWHEALLRNSETNLRYEQHWTPLNLSIDCLHKHHWVFLWRSPWYRLISKLKCPSLCYCPLPANKPTGSSSQVVVVIDFY